MITSKRTNDGTENGWLLALDTSTVTLTTALLHGERLVGERSTEAERNHSIYLLPIMQELLADAGIRSEELSAVAVGIGPGSYTGVRIAVTVAKTLAWTRKLDLVAVSSLEAMALGGAAEHEEKDRAVALVEGQADAGTGAVALGDGQVAARSSEVALRDEQQRDTIGAGALDDGHSATKIASQQQRVIEELTESGREAGRTTWVVPFIEARRGQAFTALYKYSGDGWSCVVADSIRLVASWLEELRSLAETERPDLILFTGEPSQHLESIASFKLAWDGQVETTEHSVSARYVAELGRRQWKRGDTEHAHALVPNYSQLAEAEAKLLAKRP
ncbi:tRNA (adenosine(37)-N6)-threonylcarbamoyltransferase complex dimerization subunit type 1 TsaB [Paenibacillus sp. YYML68]|uniref:tRNA (adenosine(37)-N6)-threonylcarbamoyltransferase complex dimerization subunit type 1 TsaB n=1 Tax=Paenibacillus sp. YYML68 TaxID=2909250 RepID=UPI002493856C|nr:tRNA (adenosine(37)-N6)-threonylcarbamoyltransferase complex dimerization subunit type 1 TsaB [Paenibacillus sp. YYML68]